LFHYISELVRFKVAFDACLRPPAFAAYFRQQATKSSVQLPNTYVSNDSSSLKTFSTAIKMDASYLTTQVNTIVAQLHGVFDEIGVPSHEREARETEVYKEHACRILLRLTALQLFSALSETLHNQLKLVNA
jgi:hypothetical protein